MGEMLSAGLRARYAEIERQLDQASQGAGDRATLKEDIIALFRQVEREITELGVLKEDIRRLVDKWKSITPAESAPAHAPPPAEAMAGPAAPAPARADHLGASTFIEKGWSRIALGDHVGAEEALTRALQLSPDDPHTESLLGWAQMLQEKYDDALLNFQRALMRQPTNALARINLGYICLKKRIFGEAIEHLSKAIRLDNDPKATLYAHYYLGLVYLEREMFEDAQTFFRKSLALGPNLIEAFYELGRALWFAGDQEQAKQAWRDGASANKFNPWGKRCAELLKEIEGGGAPPPLARR
jgi:tetratricopeptide (TPR) repeat protein